MLGRVQSRQADAVRVQLEQALARWKELPEASRHLPEGVVLTPAHRWEDSYPQEGLVLVRTARDLDAKGLGGERSSLWNRDYAWFSREETRPFTGDLGTGQYREMPLIARRLARFHLVDNVRGQTLPYADQEIRRARLRATITARVGSTFVMRLEGETEAIAEGPWLLGDNLWKPGKEHPHGIETRLHGRATFDESLARFTSFELIAIGRRFGITQNNGRSRAPTPSLVAFHLTQAAAEPRIAPTFVAVYDADWVVPPAIGTWNESPAECGLEQE